MIEATIFLYEGDVRAAKITTIPSPADNEPLSVLSISDMKIFVHGEGADRALEDALAALRRHFKIEGA